MKRRRTQFSRNAVCRHIDQMKSHLTAEKPDVALTVNPVLDELQDYIKSWAVYRRKLDLYSILVRDQYE